MPIHIDGPDASSGGIAGGTMNFINRDAVQRGGFKCIGAEALPNLGSAGTLFPTVPAGTVYILMSLVGSGSVVVTFDGTTTPTSTVGIQYAGGSSYAFHLTYANAQLCKGITSGTITSGYITYFGLA